MSHRQQEEALEVAKLAAMVGGQLRAVDQLRSDSGGMPANRIDINSFIAKAKGQNVRQQGGFLPVDNLQKKAMEDAMREAMMVPDVPSWSPPPSDVSSQMIPLPPNPIPAPNTGAVIASDALKNIEEKIEKIGNTLENLLELIQTTLNQNE
jgi:hypothetical protein